MSSESFHFHQNSHLGLSERVAFLRWACTGARQKRRECNKKRYSRRLSHIELFSVSQAPFEALFLATVPVSRIDCIIVHGGGVCVPGRVLTCNLSHKSPLQYGIPEEGRPALGTDPILLGPPCVLVASASKHFMEESRPVTVQGLYERLLNEVRR